ncbi:MAG TPA: hypothetical protein VFM37_14105, partial [Pseudonocardiaceae bacterium]|nr:hypothetical protein [Pseudonocardiaceae bacterium]
MTDQRPHRINRVDAECLLDGGPGTGVPALLVAQLRAAAGPAQAHELAGERAALAAFRAAALDPNPRHPNPRRRPSALGITAAKLLTVKAAAMAAVVTAGAGSIALAAGAGVLPIELPIFPAAPAATHPPASPAEQSSPEGNGGDPAGIPSPSITALCEAYAAEVSNDPGQALEGFAFRALVTVAGGADKVDGFCETQAAGSEGDGDDEGGDEGEGDGDDEGDGDGDVPGNPPSTTPRNPPS